MSDPRKAYPLKWPAGWERTDPSARKPGKFFRVDKSGAYPRQVPVQIGEAVNRIVAELRRMGFGLTEFTLSTNNPSNQGGLPRADREPVDPGAAVYWQDGDQELCMAIDIYDSLAHNLAAIAATLEYMRGIERHGGSAVMARTFVGLKALPSSTGPTMSTEAAAGELAAYVGGLSRDSSRTAILTSAGDAKAAVQLARTKAHPDANGGNREKWDKVEAAASVLSSHHGVSL